MQHTNVAAPNSCFIALPEHRAARAVFKRE